MDDIIYGAPLGPRVLNAMPMDDYKLLLTFNNDEERIFDVKPWLIFDIFKELKNKTVFNAVYVAHGSVQWLDEIDFCPDTLYTESILLDNITKSTSNTIVAEPQFNYE